MNESTSGGKALRSKDRTGWAIDYLYWATLLNRVERGKYIISEEGEKVLKNNPEYIDNDFLLRYESFKEFKDVNAVSSDEKYEKEIMSPSDKINEAISEINNNLSSNILEEIFSWGSDFFWEVTR